MASCAPLFAKNNIQYDCIKYYIIVTDFLSFLLSVLAPELELGEIKYDNRNIWGVHFCGKNVA